MTGANVLPGSGAGSGAVYCFKGLGFEPKAAVATAEGGTLVPESRSRIATVALPADGTCPAGSQASVAITRAGMEEEGSFYVFFE